MPDSRIPSIVGDLVDAIHALVEKHRITPEEYHAAVDFLNEAGDAGEIPLLLDVFLEARVVDAGGRDRRGTASNVLGPYYLEDAPFLGDEGCLASKGEAGDRLVVSGAVRDVEGRPLSGAVLDFWQADARGRYSGFDVEPPDMNLRGRIFSGEEGRYEIHTVRPGAYTIPHDGPTGRLFRALGRHPWRPAHIHMKATHEGHRPLTTQIYLAGSDYLDSDAANAVREELVFPLKQVGSGYAIDFDVVLEPA